MDLIYITNHHSPGQHETTERKRKIHTDTHEKEKEEGGMEDGEKSQ